MKIFRHFQHALILSAIVALALFNSGCEYAKKVIAKDQLNQGAILYNQGNTTKAKEFFQSATDTDPNNTVAWLYYGATMVKEYKAQEDEAKKVELANQALGIYKTALKLSENNCANYDNAISYIATIYDDLSNTDEWRNWMLQRAEGKCVVSNEVKATTYYAVAVKFWTCSYDQTTRYQDKGAQDPFHYRNMDYPAALPDKKKAEDCAAKGLEYIEKAIQVDPQYVDAMFYKGLLYREKQKLTKEEAKRKELSAIAVKIAEEATVLMKKKEAEAAKQALPEG